MKKFLILLVIFVGAIALTGCKKNEFDAEFEIISVADLKAAAEINISFRVPSGIISTALATLLEEFKLEWPNINVELIAESGGYNDVRKLTILDLNNGIGPTMVIGYPDHFAEYFSGSHLINLENFIKSGVVGVGEDDDFVVEDFLTSYLDENRIADEGDDLYGLPFNKSTEVLIYNKTFFEHMKYTVPTTWAEVETLSRTILVDVAAGKADDVIAFGEGEKKPSQYLTEGTFIPIAYDSTSNAIITAARQWKGAYSERATIEKGYAIFNNNEVKTALTFFQGLANDGLYAVAESFGESYASNAFKLLKCVMTIGSSAGVGYNVPEGNKFAIGVAPIPYHTADAKFVIQQGTNIAILGQSTNIQRSAAWQLLRFLLSSENTAKFAMATGGYLPVRKSSYETVAYKAFLATPPVDKIYPSMAANIGLQYRDTYNFFVDDAFVGSSAIRDAVGSMFSAVIVNKKDITKAIQDTLNELGPKYQK
ncbi:MAG TPA: extracellular solute-binding protein [Bacilli bacterium]|nr:extracellular solute-binding protein [Bacilli bacterium]